MTYNTSSAESILRVEEAASQPFIVTAVSLAIVPVAITVSNVIFKALVAKCSIAVICLTKPSKLLAVAPIVPVKVIF